MKKIISLIITVTMIFSLFIAVPVEAASYTNWKQYQGEWSSYTIGNSSSKVSKKGCAVVSLAMAAVKLGCENERDFNPGIFLKRLNSKGCFSGAAIYWNSVYKAVPDMKFCGEKKFASNLSKSDRISQIKSYINQGYAVVITIFKGYGTNKDGSTYKKWHYVLADSVSGNDVYLLDPGASNGYMSKSYPNAVTPYYSVRLYKNNGSGTKYIGQTEEKPVSHTHSYSTGYEAIHPHRIYNKCSCGNYSYTGQVQKITSCSDCYPLGYISLTRSFEKTKGTATFYRNNVNNATGYTLKLYKNNSLYNTYTMSNDKYTVRGLPSGEYYAVLYARNSSTDQEGNDSCSSFKIADTYTVSYNANGGTNAPSSQTKIEDTALTLTSSIPTKEGHIFKGWASSKNAIEAQYNAGGTYTKNAKITLYAVWEPETYTITFDTNGGIGTVKSETVTYGNTIKMPNSIVKDYSYLIGWSTNKNATTAEYKLGIDYKIKSNLTLYAIWGEAAWNNEISDSLTGSGIEEDPYLISTAADLAYLANKVNTQTATPSYEYYKLTDNINLTYSEWIPIGVYNNENQYFYGSFDGNGYTISDLYMTKANQGYVGLFGYVKNSEFKNLTVTGAIEGITSTNKLNIGGIIGYSDNSKLVGLSAKYFNIGSIAAGATDYSSVGAVVGKTSSGTIESCEAYNSSINLKSGKFQSGMIAGYCDSDITNCKVESTEGGLFSTSATVGSFYMGGLCGTLNKNADKCSVKAPYFSNNIKTTDSSNIGGLVGELSGTVKICSVQFDDSSENSITSTGTGTAKVGGFIGNMTADAKITDCKFDGKTISETTTSSSAYTGGLAGYATAKTNPTFSARGGNFLSYADLPKKDGYKATWYTDSSFTMPYDFSQQVTSHLTLYAKWEKGDDTPDIWDGTSKEPAYNAETKTYTITNGEELAWVSDVTNGVITSGTNFPTDITFSGYTIELANDIYLNDTTDWESWSDTVAPQNTWKPIGEDYTNSFKGTFNGNGRTVRGIYINKPAAECQGLFGYIIDGTIEKTCVADSCITGSWYVGGIVGRADGDTNIIDCHNSGTVSGSYWVGGIAGGVFPYTDRSADISRCSNTGKISGRDENIGGIAGYVGYSQINLCYNLGVVSGNISTGGIIGRGSSNSVTYCYNSGKVSGPKETGGVCGTVSNSSIKYCYNIADITGSWYVGGLCGRMRSGSSAYVCYNVGSISGYDVYWGGLIGGLNGDSDAYCSLSYCYCPNSKMFYAENNYYTTNSVSRQTYTTMKSYLSDLAGFSSSDWGMSIANGGYPYLKALKDTYWTYTITPVLDEDNSAINRAFVNVDGDITATASRSACAGSILGYGYGPGINKNIVGMADNVLSSTTDSSYSAYSGNVIGNNNKFSFENVYYNDGMNVGSSTNTIDTTGIARSSKTMNTAFYTNVLGLTPYTSIDGLQEDENAVWILKNGKLPELYYNCLNDITISQDIENGTISVDKTQAVDNEIVTVTATPNTNYILNKIYVNGEEIDGATFEVSGDSEIFATFSEKIPEFNVTLSDNDNATGTLVNVDSTEPALMSFMSLSDESGSSITAKDGEEIQINTTANTDYTVDAIYVNGKEITSDSFILTDNSVVTMDVISISTDIIAVTNDAEDVTSQSAVVSGSISGNDAETIKYIEYWSETDDQVIVTEIENGSGEYSCTLDYLLPNTTYYYRMTENGDIKSFTTDEEEVTILDESEIDSPSESESTPITTTTYKKITSTNKYKFTLTADRELNDESVYVAAYNSDGLLLSLTSVSFVGDTETTAYLPILTDISYVKIFVWKEQMQPLSIAERIEITE